MLEVYEANTSAGRAYEPGPVLRPHHPLPGGGEERPRNPDLGWGRITESVEVHAVPSHHLALVAEPNVRALARQLRESLEDVWAEEPVEA